MPKKHPQILKIDRDTKIDMLNDLTLKMANWISRGYTFIGSQSVLKFDEDGIPMKVEAIIRNYDTDPNDKIKLIYECKSKDYCILYYVIDYGDHTVTSVLREEQAT